MILNHVNLLENILFGKKNDFKTLKVIDFGLSAKYNLYTYYTISEHWGTYIYMAPEII